MPDIRITLNNGDARSYPAGTVAADIAADISSSLAKNAVSCIINGTLRDIYLPLNEDGTVEFITRDDDAALELIRHDCAHLLAQAVGQLFPDAQPTMARLLTTDFFMIFIGRHHLPQRIWR